MTFIELGLSKDLLQAVRHAGYQEPTAIQVEAIPLILQRKDLIAESRTGTGKTAGYLLPLLQLLQLCPNERERTLKALILAPTRELAMQINTAIKVFGRALSKPMRSVLIIGGMNIDVQLRSLIHGADIVVATPGRLLDVAKRQEIGLHTLKFLVIDEADKIFDLGFSQELESVLKLLPRRRQNLLFSATIDEKVGVLAKKFMPQALAIKIAAPTATVETIHQRAIEVNREVRGPLLRHLIQTEKWTDVLVFVASIRGADILAVKLNKAGIQAEVFHGGLTQTQRTAVLSDFKSKKITVLVATDLAARGIDIDKLATVVNYDLPRSSEDYIHRIGRTARAGASGMAISFIGHENKAHFALIEKRVRVRIARESVAGFELTGDPLPPMKGSAPVKGLRMSKKDKARAAAKKAVEHG